MNLKNQRPVFVPEQFIGEIEKLSKAALMDIAWDLATRCSGGDDLQVGKIMTEFRDTAEIIVGYRRQQLSNRAAIAKAERADPEDDYAQRAEWKARS